MHEDEINQHLAVINRYLVRDEAPPLTIDMDPHSIYDIAGSICTKYEPILVLEEKKYDEAQALLRADTFLRQYSITKKSELNDQQNSFLTSFSRYKKVDCDIEIPSSADNPIHQNSKRPKI